MCYKLLPERLRSKGVSLKIIIDRKELEEFFSEEDFYRLFWLVVQPDPDGIHHLRLLDENDMEKEDDRFYGDPKIKLDGTEENEEDNRLYISEEYHPSDICLIDALAKLLADIQEEAPEAYFEDLSVFNGHSTLN